MNSREGEAAEDYDDDEAHASAEVDELSFTAPWKPLLLKNTRLGLNFNPQYIPDNDWKPYYMYELDPSLKEPASLFHVRLYLNGVSRLNY